MPPCFSTGEESNQKEQLLFWYKVTAWPAAVLILPPRVSVFLLDILSLINCHSCHSERKLVVVNTRPSPWGPIVWLQLYGILPIQKATTATTADRSSFTGMSVCVLPSLIFDHTESSTHDRQPLPFGSHPDCFLLHCLEMSML